MLVLGNNGSGKTTLMQILKGLCVESSGEVLFDNVILHAGQRITNQAINYTHPNDCGLFRDLSVKEASLLYIGLLLNLSPREAEVCYDKVERMFHLKSLSDSIYKNTSRGQKQWVQTSLAFVNPETKYILLDEPLNYLDEDRIQIFNDVLKSTKDKSVLFSAQTSLDSSISHTCQRINL